MIVFRVEGPHAQALFANESGAYDDLVAYLRKRRLI